MGSDPPTKVLNGPLNTPSSFAPGGTVHFAYNAIEGTENLTIQDCVVTYPSGFFSPDDFDPTTGVLTSGAYSKSTLAKGGTPIDGASLSGFSSGGNVYYSWTSPADLGDGTWVCNFARDGDRKARPTCYQVTGGGTT